MKSRLIFGVVVWLLLFVPGRAQAWFCQRSDETAADVTDAHERSESIFSQFKDNYFLSGLPNKQGTPEGFIRFQISVKANLIPSHSPCTAFFVFSQKSLWDLWNGKGSSPFVDSNYNPGLFLAWRKSDRAPWRVSERGLSLLGVFAGFEHESNGRDGSDSRSWNRVTAFARIGYRFPFGIMAIAQPMLWIPFGYKGGGLDASGVDTGGNPDILKYYGYGQLNLEVGQESTRLVEGESPLNTRNWAVTAMARVGSSAEHLVFELTGRKRLDVFYDRIPISIFAQCSLWNGEVLLTYNKPRNVCRLGLSVDDRPPEYAISSTD